jgi:protein-tyrosine-phosphatase
MAESGIDIAGHFSKSLLSIDADGVDYLISFESDLDFPSAYENARRLDWAIYAPIDIQLPERAMLSAFRLKRDIVHDRVKNFCRAIKHNNPE